MERAAADRGIKTQEAFFAFLRLALFDLPLPEGFSLSDKQWGEILEMAEKQQVVGIVSRAVSRLDPSIEVPESILFRLMVAADGIRRQSRKVLTLSRTLVAEMAEAGLHPIIMKGPSVAAFYPEPELRTAGDIDLFLPEEDFQLAADMAGRRGLSVEISPDGSVLYTRDGIVIDLHRCYFDLHVQAEALPPVPSAEATLLMLSSHILKHCLGPGIGMRQLCDIALAYRALPYDRERLLAYFRESKTLRWNRLLAAFLAEVLGADPGLFPGERIRTRPLRRIVLRSGGFGRGSNSRRQAEKAGRGVRKLDTALRFLRRIPFSLRFAPREFFRYTGSLVRGNVTKSGEQPLFGAKRPGVFEGGGPPQ